MASEKQKQAARHNLEKARSAQAKETGAGPQADRSSALSTAEKNDLDQSDFAFVAQRKEPLTDAQHVRNAVARFDQVEGVTDADRDKAWGRIKSAARKYDVDLSERDWRELAHGGKDN